METPLIDLSVHLNTNLSILKSDLLFRLIHQYTPPPPLPCVLGFIVAYLLTISDMSSEFMTFKPIMPANKKDLVVVEQKNNWNLRFYSK